MNILLIVAAAFLAGVAGTASLMSRQAAPVPGATHAAAKQDLDTKQDPDQKKAAAPTDGGQAAGDSKVTLDPAAVRNAGISVETVRSASQGATLTAPGTIEAATGSVAKVTPPGRPRRSCSGGPAARGFG